MSSNAPDPIEWPFLIINWILLVIMIVISIYFYRRILCDPISTKHPVSRKIVKISIITFTLYFGAIFFNAVSAILHALGQHFDTWNALASLFYVVGLHLFLLVFIYRLDSLDAMFSYSKKVIYFFYACVCVLVLFVLSLIIIWMAGLKDMVLVLGGFWLLLYAIVWIAMVVAFFRKIVHSIKFDAKEMGKNAANTSTGKSQTHAIDVTSTCSLTRYSLLVLIAFLSTLFNLISALPFVAITGSRENWSAPLDSVINAICICLLFRFSTNIYYSVCCCDACFARCFMRGVFKDAKNNEQEIYQQLIFEQTRTVLPNSNASVGLQEMPST